MSYGALTVNTTAQQVPVGTRIIVNNSTNTVYWGENSSVTAVNGTPLYPNQSLRILTDKGSAIADIWLYAASSSDVRYNSIG